MLQVNDVISLLNTNEGRYGAACSMDFSKPPSYYDTFALRDYKGDEHVMQKWPYFRSAASRDALMAMSPVPVKSCWNGMGGCYSNTDIFYSRTNDAFYSGHAYGPVRVGSTIAISWTT